MADETDPGDVLANSPLSVPKEVDPGEVLRLSPISGNTPLKAQEHLEKVAKSNPSQPLSDEEFKSQVAPFLQQNFPGVDTDKAHEAYAHQRNLERARDAIKDQSEGAIHYMQRTMVPFASRVKNIRDARDYQEAVRQFQAGNQNPDVYNTIAGYERIQQIRQQQGLGGDIADIGANAASMLGEAAMGGKALGTLGKAVPALGFLAPEAAAGSTAATVGGFAGRTLATTAVNPSLYLDQAVQNSVQNGGNPADAKNLAPAFAMGALQVAVLGSLGNQVKGVPGGGVANYLKTMAYRTGVGITEQAGIDVAASGIDAAAKKVLGQSIGLDTRYGTVGTILRGENDGMKHLVNQAVMFGGFAVLHGRKADPVKQTVDRINEMADEGYSKPEIVAQVQPELEKQVNDLLQDTKPAEAPDPATLQAMASGLTPEEAAEVQKYSKPAESPPAAPTDPETTAPKPKPAVEQPKTAEAAQPEASVKPGGDRLAPDQADELLRQINEQQPSGERLTQPEKPAEGKKTEKDILKGVWEGKPVEATVGEGIHDENHPATKAFLDTFGGGRTEGGIEGSPRRVVSTIGEGPHALEVELSEGSQPDTVRFDYGWADKNRTGKLQGDYTLPLVRKLNELIGRFRDAGQNVEYTAIGGRENAYKRIMERNGYEQVSGPTGEGNGLRMWQPKAEAPAAPLSRAEQIKAKMRERAARSGMKPRPAPMAEVETPLGQAPPRSPEEIAALGSSEASSQPAVKITEATRNELTRRIEAGEGNLDVDEQEILKERVNEGTSFREIAKALGVSQETVRNREKSGLAKLGYTGSVNDFHKNSPAGKIVADVEKGEEIAGQGLAVPGFESSVNARINEISEANDEYNALKAQIQREKNSGPIPAGKQSRYVARFEALLRVINGGHEEAIAAKEGGRAERAGEAPVRPGDERGVQEGAPAEQAGPPSPGGEATGNAPTGQPTALPGGIDTGGPPAPAGGGPPGDNQLKETNRERLRREGREGRLAQVGLTEEQAANLTKTQWASLFNRTTPPYIKTELLHNARGERTVFDEVMSETRGKGLSLASFGPEELAGLKEMGLPKSLFTDRGMGPDEVAAILDRQGLLSKDPGLKDTDRLINDLVAHRLVEGENLIDSEAHAAERQYHEDKIREQLLNDNPEWSEADVDREVARMVSEAGRDKAVAPPIGEEPEGVQPTPDEDQGQGNEPTAEQMKSPLWKSATDFLTEDFAALDLDKVKEVWQKLVSGWKGVNNHLNKLAGAKFPKTSRLDADAGNAAARFDTAPAFGRLSAVDYINRIVGKESTPEQAKLWGTTLMEERKQYATANLRKMSAGFSYLIAQARAAGDMAAARRFATKATEAMNQADKIAKNTEIGKKDSVLQTLADFQKAKDDKSYLAMKQRYTAELTGPLEQWFREAEGMEDTDPIKSNTQLPGLPFHAQRIEEGPPEPEKIGSSRGALANRRVPKLQSALAAGLDADMYQTDLREMIAHTIQSRVTLAAKTTMLKAFLKAGLAQTAAPGEYVGNAERFDRALPPKGAAFVPDGHSDYWVTKEGNVNDEFRQVLRVDRPATLPYINEAASAATWGSLISTLEATYHSRNNLSLLLKAGVSVRDFVSNAVSYIRDSPDVMGKLVELARIGAGHEHLPEHQDRYWFDPRGKTTRFLNGLGDVMRMTLDDAFTRMAERPAGWGKVENTEQNRRDFVNQAGNYSKGSQNRLVAGLRDLGIGPFATAGSNYIMQGIRSVTGNPGATAASASDAVFLRAEQYARVLSVVGATAAVNYLMHGRADGDDNTPLGHVKLWDKPNGKTATLDLTSFTGLPRGMRQLGIMAAAEGYRRDTPAGKQLDNAITGAVGSAAHPALGPLPAFMWEAYSGRDTMGRQIANRVSTATTPIGILKARAAGKPEAGSSQMWENLKAALWSAIPLVKTFSGQGADVQEKSAGERALELLGPFGPQERGSKTKRRRITR